MTPERIDGNVCPTTDTIHDWRVDPNVILLSNPPRQRLVCANCGQTSSRGTGTYYDQGSPQTWEKA